MMAAPLPMTVIVQFAVHLDAKSSERLLKNIAPLMAKCLSASLRLCARKNAMAQDARHEILVNFAHFA